MEENFSVELKKIASLEYGKIIVHSIPCPGTNAVNFFLFIFTKKHVLLL